MIDEWMQQPLNIFEDEEGEIDKYEDDDSKCNLEPEDFSGELFGPAYAWSLSI